MSIPRLDIMAMAGAWTAEDFGLGSMAAPSSEPPLSHSHPCPHCKETKACPSPETCLFSSSTPMTCDACIDEASKRLFAGPPS